MLKKYLSIIALTLVTACGANKSLITYLPSKCHIQLTEISFDLFTAKNEAEIEQFFSKIFDIKMQSELGIETFRLALFGKTDFVDYLSHECHTSGDAAVSAVVSKGDRLRLLRIVFKPEEGTWKIVDTKATTDKSAIKKYLRPRLDAEKEVIEDLYGPASGT